MADQQVFTFVLAMAPTTLTVLINNSRLSDLRSHIDRRFDEMKDLGRSELHHFEEVLDARFKHLEER